MKLWEQFLELKAQIHNIITDEDKRHADARFLRSIESIERVIKRSLTGSEYRILFTLDDPQAELVKNLLQEARNEPQRSNQTDGRAAGGMQGMPKAHR